MLRTTTSANGTTIAFETYGEGEPVVLVSGATSHRAVMTNLDSLSAAMDEFSLVAYDRRGRGDSGDSPPYSPAREVEDLFAVVAATGARLVHGHSSGAVLTLDSLAAGLPVRRATLYEPPLIVDDSRPPVPRDLLDRLRTAADAGDREACLRMFFTDAIGVPGDQVVAQLKATPFWDALEAAGHTTVYDTELMRGLMEGEPLPTDRWAAASVPVLVLAGTASGDFMRSGARALVEVLPDATYGVLEGQGHGPEDDALASAVVPFLSAG